MMLKTPLLALLVLVSASQTAAAQAAQQPPVPSSLGREYVKPHQLVDVDRGRKINLFCIGNGPTTVLFDSGLSDWSNTWVLIQPEIAQSARACSYDRAGMGYSDPAPNARTPLALVSDIHALVEAAKIDGPIVLVGHSLGGFNVKLYSALYPERVAGLVLVDPSEERLYERGAAALQAKFGARVTSKLELADRALIGMLVDRFDQCAAKAAEADLDPASIGYKRCTDPVRPQLGPDIVAERPNVQKKAAYQAAQASELSNSVFADKTGDAAYARLFTRHMLGNKPLIVLTHGNYDAEDPEAVADNFLINRLHAETAALSRRGTHRVVPNTNHNIQVEDPQAIIQAIRDVLLAAAI